MTKKIKILIVIAVLVAVVAVAAVLFWPSAPKAQLDPFWNQADDNNISTIDHRLWQELLEEYLIAEHPSGVNRFDYGGLQDDGPDLLTQYINDLAALDPREYARSEQFAYWVNLYNALTVQLIVANYPLDSIRQLGSPTAGPWDDIVITIAGKELSLNNIEHNILRPIWQDYRIHFAVNCASIGCPNLLDIAFTAENTEALLNRGTAEYLTHLRGLRFDSGQLTLSSIFNWYQQDFGTDETQLLNTLAGHVDAETAELLKGYSGNIHYEYDWSLNAE